MRRAHNKIKRDLIDDSLHLLHGHKELVVLDVGCGSGGDLGKWISCNIKQLHACDPSESALCEARRRAKTLLDSSSDGVHFYVGDITSTPRTLLCNIISYQFSLQYVFVNRDKFKETLDGIEGRLVPGGILIGCIPNSEFIVTCCEFRDTNGNYYIRDPVDTGLGNFGEEIQFFLANTPYYANGPVGEPIAYKDLLVHELQKRGVHLLKWEKFHHTKTREFSKVYVKFIFQKSVAQKK